MKNKFKDVVVPIIVMVPLIVLTIFWYLPSNAEDATDVPEVDQEEPTGELNLLIWSGYVPEDGEFKNRKEKYNIYKRFERKYGVKVNITYQDTNEQLYDILRENADDPIFDLVMPTNYLVPVLEREDLIQKINPNNIPNYEGLDLGIFQNHDMGEILQYSVPYIFGISGLAYNRSKVNQIPAHWSFFFAPGEGLPPQEKKNLIFTLNNRMSLIDDTRITMGCVLIHLGYDPQTENPDEINEAKECLINMIKNFNVEFANDRTIEKMVNSELYMVMAWSGDAMVIMQQSLDKYIESARQKIAKLNEGNAYFDFSGSVDIPKIRFTSPQPKTLGFTDCFSIVKDAPNVSNAEKFIGFLLDPIIAAQVTNYSLYGNTVLDSKVLIESNILSGPTYFLPSDDTLQFMGPLSDEIFTIYLNAWKEIKLVYEENQKRLEQEE